MSNMIVRKSGGGLAINNGPTVLGERQARIPVGGRIRAGVKVLTSAATKGPKGKQAQQIYDRGVRAGASWDDIEKALRDKCGFDRSPLTPRNVPYFTVRRSDFQVPETADAIMDQYAEPDEDGVPRLYRFPVIFATDNWQANMPHALKAYTRSELLYWSEYDQDGTRRCYTRAQVQVDQRNRRAKAHRPYGGRPVVLRQDNGGVCDPNSCPEYQNRQCTLSGSLLFFIPGVPGTSAIELPTTSFYALQQARQKMEMVAFLRGGRISGTHQGAPIFFITKTQQEVPMIDPETGKAKRVRQYLVTLEADIDMTSVFQAAEHQQLEDARQAGGAAAAALEHRRDIEDELDGQGEPLPADEPPPQEWAEDEAPEQDEGPEPVTGELVDDEPGAGDPGPQDDDKAQVRDLRAQAFQLVEQVGIVPDVFNRWAIEEQGQAWARNADGLHWAVQQLQDALASDDLQAWKEARGLDVPF